MARPRDPHLLQKREKFSHHRLSFLHRKATEPATTIVLSLYDNLTTMCCLRSHGTEWFWRILFPDRKFASRWVLFNEGDGRGMSKTGYILS